MYIGVSINVYVLIGTILILLLLFAAGGIRRYIVLPSRFTFIKDVLIFALLFFSIGVGLNICIKEKDQVFLNNIDQYLVANQKVRIDAKITDIVNSKDSKRFYADVIRVEDSVVKGKISLYFNTNQRDLEVGDIISYQSNIKLINPPKNIGQFDYKRYMMGKGIYVQSYVDEFDIIGRERSWRYKILEWRVQIIDKVQSSNNTLSNEAKALLTALLLGEKSYIDNEVLSQFKDVGVMHVLAISGLHVGLLYFVLFWSFSFLPPKYRQLVILLVLWFFVFLSGFSASVFRAVFMFSIFTVCRLIRREQSLEHSIGLTLFFSLCIYPQWVYDIGFQLSYLAVISIVYFMPLFKGYYAKNKVLKYIQGIFYVSLSVQIGLIPLQLYYFHQFSFAFLIANLLVIPLITLLVILGIGYLCTMWLDGVSSVIGWLFSRFTDILYYLVGLITDMNYLSFNQLKLSEYQFILLIVMIVLVTLAYYRKKVGYFIIAICTFVVFQIGFIISQGDVEKVEFEVIIPFQSKSKDRLAIWVREYDKLHIISNQWDTVHRSKIDVDNYLEEYNINQVVYHNLNGIVPSKAKDILVMNNAYFSYDTSQERSIIIFAQQPKINFERMIEVIKPELVIFHNSVPFWYKKKCIVICLKKNIPFHDIYEKGYWSSLL